MKNARQLKRLEYLEAINAPKEEIKIYISIVKEVDGRIVEEEPVLFEQFNRGATRANKAPPFEK